MSRVRILATVAFVTLAAAQSQAPAERREFEVASIKSAPFTTGGKDGSGGSFTRTIGGLIVRNADLTRLIEMAFETRLTDLSRVPDSVRSERFEIVARASGKISANEYWPMLQRLIEDRFKLKFHREKKDAQVFALGFAKPGSTLGPKINRSADADCPVNTTNTSFCGIAVRPGLMNAQRASLDRLATELSPFAGQPVQNHTGLTGFFDFELRWTPPEYYRDDGQVRTLNGAALDTSFPNLFEALQEQFGLKLESRKGQVEILVIDHAERPSEN